jgi:hypothetical protein
MAEEPVSPMDLTEADIIAGTEYLASLRKLGLEPDALCWIVRHFRVDDDSTQSEKHLALVSSLADRYGPRQIYDLLFLAYDASATPKEVDPFIVSLYGPKTAVGRTLLAHLQNARVREAVQDAVRSARIGRDPGSFDEGAAMIMTDPDTLTMFSVLSAGIFVVKKRGFTPAADQRRFSRFKNEVESLAA